MKRICNILILCFLLLLTACAESDLGYGIPVCPDFSAVTETDDGGSGTEEEAYAIVDWMIFVRYNGRSYTRDFAPPTVIAEEKIGTQLGTVESKPPYPTPIDYVTNVPDLTSSGYPIGAHFYEITGSDPAYEIAVYDRESDEYHLLCYGDSLPNEAKIVRGGWLEGEFSAPGVRLYQTYDEFPAGHREQFPEYDAAFFENNVLAVVYLEEGSGSITHEVTGVRRVGESIEIHIRREIPEVGTCDMAYWTIAAEISREDWDGAEIVPVINTHQFWSE